MLDLQISSDEDEKQFRHLTKEIENISEKNKKISKNNQYKKLLEAIDIHKIQASPIKEYESYDELQEELGKYNAVATGALQTIKKLEKLKR